MFCSGFLRLGKDDREEQIPNSRDLFVPSAKIKSGAPESPRSQRRSKMNRASSNDFELAEKGKRRISYRKIYSNTAKEEQSDDDMSQRSLNEGAQKYISSRQMTAFQERVNGLTDLPAAFFVIFYVLSGSWLTSSVIETVRNEATEEIFDDQGCISTSWLPHFHALPPYAVIAVALATLFHGPFSFIYHYKYAHRLPMEERIGHWSRRMDQSMLHVYSSLIAYAFSGSPRFLVALGIFNIDSIYRQFLKKVVPSRNQIRLIVATMASAIPVLLRKDFDFFLKLWSIKGLGFLVFATYPFGGWSHSVFHCIYLLIPPVTMKYVIGLPASQDQLIFAANCAITAELNILGTA